MITKEKEIKIQQAKHILKKGKCPKLRDCTYCKFNEECYHAMSISGDEDILNTIMKNEAIKYLRKLKIEQLNSNEKPIHI